MFYICVDRYFEGQFEYIRYCKLDFLSLYNYFPLLIVNDNFVLINFVKFKSAFC